MNVAQMGRPNKILYGRLALLLHAATPARSQLCEPRTFTLLSLSEARLARSNLGGLGGRCDANAAECTDGLRKASTPAELYFESVGVGVDLRVANASEYRAWNVGSNGIVQTSGGFFGLINVLAPRDAGTGSDWHGDVTYVDLRFEFVDPINGAPLTAAKPRRKRWAPEPGDE